MPQAITLNLQCVREYLKEYSQDQKEVELANGQLDIRKAQLLARAYKKAGGGYK